MERAMEDKSGLSSAVSAYSADPSHHMTDGMAAGRSIIKELRRIVAPNGIDETLDVMLGGTLQAVNIRGRDHTNPVLLVVHGGPGTTSTPFAWSYQRTWEDFFTVVNWDQRGAGRSYSLGDPEGVAATLTLDRYRDDAIELIDYLRERLGVHKVVLLGQSWGTAIGLAVCAERPDLLHAYVGTAQIINFRVGEQVSYDMALDIARTQNNVDAIGELEALAPYPGAGDLDPVKALRLRKWTGLFGAMAFGRSDLDFWIKTSLLSPDYGPDDFLSSQRGALLSAQVMAPKLMDLDFSALDRLNAPVVIVHGKKDGICPIALVEDWIDALEAPSKHMVSLPDCAHVPQIEQPGLMLKALLDHVLPLCITGAGN